MTFLASDLKIGGFVGLNGWMPMNARVQHYFPGVHGPRHEILATLDLELSSRYSLEEEVWPFEKTPIFLSHTADDEVIDVELGRQARDTLQKTGMIVTWHEKAQAGHLGLLEQGAQWCTEPLALSVHHGFEPKWCVRCGPFIASYRMVRCSAEGRGYRLYGGAGGFIFFELLFNSRNARMLQPWSFEYFIEIWVINYKTLASVHHQIFC